MNDYITRNRHYQQIWDIVNLYDDVLCQGRSTQLPTLAIWGREDKIYDIRGALRLQRRIPGSQVSDVSGGKRNKKFAIAVFYDMSVRKGIEGAIHPGLRVTHRYRESGCEQSRSC